MTNRNYPEGSVRIASVTGASWPEIQEKARQIAGIPGGTVVPDNACSLMTRTRESGDLYSAWVVVTPPARVYPEPVSGQEYYTLDQLLEALKQLRYTEAEKIAAEVRKQLSVRDDGRYTAGEVKRAYRDCNGPAFNADHLDRYFSMARKNRVFDAYA